MENPQKNEETTLVKINYRFSDGHYEEIDVSKQFAAEYEKMETAELRRKWRDHKRGEISLDALIENGWNMEDPVYRNPEDIFVEHESVVLPLLIGLTDYQKRVAIKFFIEGKTHAQIAKDESVSRPTISNVLKRVKRKIIRQFL